MTPRVSTIDAPGRITMKLAAEEGAAAVLRFESGQVTAKVETINLADPHLREDWGENIYRILLEANAPTAQGTFTYQFSRA
jgi:hypothetical protein